MERAFEHILIIMFENQYRSYVMQNAYFRGLAQQGIELPNFFGVMHPSQTNYIASTAGELCNVTQDDRPAPLPQRTIVDLIEESPYNLTWRAYMESYIPSQQPWTPNLIPKDAFPYVIKHNPFSSFKSILENEQRWNKIQSDADFWKDLLNGTLPHYAWFTPNMWSDGHYLNGESSANPNIPRAPSLVDQAATWLEGFFRALRFPGPDSHLPPKTLVVVTFDEADFEAEWDKDKKYTYDGPNQIYTVLLGDMLNTGVETEAYNHYSLLKTIEHNFGLESLQKNDQDANWFQFLWDEHFTWGSPERTPIQTQQALSAATVNNTLFVAHMDETQQIWITTFDGTHWSASQQLSYKAKHIALASQECGLVLMYIDPQSPSENALQAITYSPLQGWSQPTVLAQHAKDVEACTFGNRIMMTYTDAKGDIHSQIYDGTWCSPVATKYQTDGSHTLGVVGTSLLLMFKTPEENTLSVVSYNTAPFNAVTVPKRKYAGPWDNTTCGKWSPSAFPVSHFSSRPTPITPGESEPDTIVYKTGGTLACCTLNGVLHLLHTGLNYSQILTETFSLHGVMTPALPISYDPALEKTTNNGYGTLAEAGWSEQKPLTGLFTSGALAAAAFQESAWILTQDKEGTVSLTQGGYTQSN